MMSGVPLGPGSFVGNRFIFEEQIGRGDLGIVFKARDLRKEQARDPHFRIAIKVLHEELKQHPNAVRAVLREARKAQTLKHPNIVAVYDCDRDGSDVYMTMELLNGESLDQVLQRVAGVGVGLEEAIRIIRGVCDAMEFAHGRGSLHADFKPANVFLTHDGLVKVLDFGIARAVGRGDWADSLLTLFDTTILSALNPAYAGYEVTEGKEADVRDDIYAIACVFYELLTGKHPYGGRSAEEACKARLQPIRPAMLSRSQWQTVRGALAFRREGRPASALQFAQGLLPKPKAPMIFLGLAAAASAVIVGTLSVMHVMNSRAHAVTEALASANKTQIESVMPWLRDFSPERRAMILADTAARAGLVSYFMQRVDASIDPKRDRYDSAPADALIKELWSLLPDSQAVNTLADRINSRRGTAQQQEKVAPTSVDQRHSSAGLQKVRLEPSSTLPRAMAPSVQNTERRALPSKTPATVTVLKQPAAGAKNSRRRNASRAVRSVSPEHSLQPQHSNVVLLSAPRLDALSQIAALKQRLLSQASSNQAQEATATLSALRERLPESDEFLTQEAPQAIASAYLRLASAAAKSGKIEDALHLAISASDAAPALRETALARDRYLQYWEIDDLLKNGERILTPHVRYRMWRVSKLAPEEMPAITQRWELDFAKRIRAAEDPKFASRLSRAGQAIFGSDSKIGVPPVEPITAEAGPGL